MLREVSAESADLSPYTSTEAGGEARHGIDLVLAELDVIRAHLRSEAPDAAATRFEEAKLLHPGPTRLDLLTRVFGLTDFERAILLLAAGPELVAAVSDELAEHTGSRRLTFGAALALLPEAHWSALTPDAPLRRWGLISLDDPRVLTGSPLAEDETVLHVLVGLDSLDPRISEISRVCAAPAWPAPAGQVVAAAALAAAWLDGPVRVDGVSIDVVADIAGMASASRRVTMIDVADLPADPDRLRALARLCARQALFGSDSFVLDGTYSASETIARVSRVFEEVPYAACVGFAPRSVVVEVPPTSLADRALLLHAALARNGVGARTDGEADVAAVAAAFALDASQRAAVASAVAGGEHPWDAARRVVRVDAGLARRIVPKARWSDLVLPPAALDRLHALVAAVRHRRTVLEDWGFADRYERGLGTSALFCGPSGTGKTFAAEVVASEELRLDLLHVDLSQVVSKYIGETEKHLARLFDEAERGGAVLLFDESDAIFGKRAEVKDSHDRYANIEIGYLLQRLERFTGLAVLTSNARDALDPAFVRRLTAIVTFPHPDHDARLAIWEGAFPERMPRGELDLDAIARIDASGGAIVSAAMAAASLAAADGGAVCTHHVERALGWELAKTGR